MKIPRYLLLGAFAAATLAFSLHGEPHTGDLLQLLRTQSYDAAVDRLEQFNRQPGNTPAEIALLESALEVPIDPFNMQRIHALIYAGLLQRGKAGEAVLMKRAKDEKGTFFSRMSAVTALRSYYPNLLRPEIDAIAEELMRQAQTEIYPDPSPKSVLTDGSFEKDEWREDWTFHQQQGGEGLVTVSQERARTGKQCLLLTKSNSRGTVFLRSRQPIVVPPNRQVPVRLYFRAVDTPPDTTLRILFEDENGNLSFGDPNRGHSALSQTLVFHTRQGEWVKRVGLTNNGKTERRYWVRIVLGGNGGTVALDDVSLPASEYTYRYPHGMVTVPTEKEPSIEPESVVHEAWVEKVDGKTRLMVDGKPTPPVLYAVMNTLAQTSYGEYEAMAKMAGVKLQVVHVPLYDAVARFPGRKGLVTWKTGGQFDFSLGHENMRHFARSSKDGLAVLNFSVAWPQDWVDKHPEDAWINREGLRAYGTDIHLRGFARELPPNHRWIPSPFSKKAIAEAQRGVAQFIDELKREGLDRRVVGCHIAGGHDGQFYTGRFADYSPAAQAAFREWLKERYGSSEALAKAWNRPEVTLETVEIPEWIEEASDSYFFSPDKHQAIIDHRQFMYEQGTRIMESLAQTAKEAMGKRIFALAWTMGGNFGGTNGDELFTVFLKSKVLDGIVAQPSYELRVPGAFGGFVSAFESFHEHGKLLIKELDLRTWLRPGAPEATSQQQGSAMSQGMFEDVHRKEAGEMIAAGHGYWFFDIGTTHFRDPGMLREINRGVTLYHELLQSPAPKAHHEVALVYGENSRYWLADFPVASRSMQSRLDRYTDISLRSAGVPFECWYLDDFLAKADLSRIKVVIFFNLLRLTDEQRRAIQERVATGGRVLVWNYAPNYITSAPMPENISSITGMKVARTLVKQLPLVRSSESQHPYALPKERLLGMGETSWIMTQLGLEGRNLKTAFERFSIEDPDAHVLARYEDGHAAVAVKGMGHWTSLYFAQPGTLDSLILRKVAETKSVKLPGGYREAASLGAGFASFYTFIPQNQPLNLPKNRVDAFTGKAMIPSQSDAATASWYLLLQSSHENAR